MLLAVFTVLLVYDYSQFEGAEAEMRSMQMAQAEPVSDAAVPAHGGDPRAALDNALHAASEGRHGEAIAAFTQAMELAPNQPILYSARAESYIELGRYDEALGDLNTAVESLPDELNIRQQRAFVLNKVERYEEAIEDMNYIVAKRPEDPVIYFNRASIYFEIGDYNAAIADYDECIARDSTLTSAYFNRGKANRENGDEASARRDIKKFIELSESEEMKDAGRDLLKQWKGEKK